MPGPWKQTFLSNSPQTSNPILEVMGN